MTAIVETKNEKTLQQIALAVSRSQGQFKLMRLRCDYRQLQDHWATRLQQYCQANYGLNLPCLELKPENDKLFSQIQEFLETQPTVPGGIQVLGFEKLNDRPEAFKTLNLIREDLNLLSCPVLWWLDESSARDFMHYANDLHSWTTGKQFLTDANFLEQIINDYADHLTSDLEQGTSDQWVGERSILSPSDRAEINSFKREIQDLTLDFLAPTVRAKFHFVAGRAAYETEQWQDAEKDWRSSLDIDSNPWVLFQLGLAILKQAEQDTSRRAEAARLFDRSGEALPQLHQCGAIVLLRGWQQSSPALDVTVLNPEALDRCIAALEPIAEFDRVGFPLLHCQALARLQALHFQGQNYSRAFDLQQKRQEVERIYGLRAFIGAGRLKAQVVDRYGENLPLEIEQSGRGEDVRELLERIGGTTHRIIVLQGPSGVGKSSLVNAGLIPSLEPVVMGGQGCYPVVIRRYKNWMEELTSNLPLPGEVGQTSETTTNPPTSTSSVHRLTPQRGTGEFLDFLRQQTQNNLRPLRPVLIFDQFEEFFFAHPSLTAQRQFFEFLGQILADSNLLSTKMVLSLRRDYLHLLLVCNESFQKLNVQQLRQAAEDQVLQSINIDILSRQVLYPINNLTPERTQRVITTLTTNAHFPLDSDLVEQVVADLAAEDGVRPIELQIVGTQLQDGKIQTLANYKALGDNPKQTLVQNYLQSIVKACGPEQEKLAELVLYSLTDEQGTRPLQTHPEIFKAVEIVAQDEGWDKNTLEAKLTLVLDIFVKSGLVMLLPAQPLAQYQLVHDYLSAFIRSTRESRVQELTVRLNEEQRLRQEAERSLAEIKELMRQVEEEQRLRQEAEKSLAEVERQKQEALQVREQAELQAAEAQQDLQRTKRQTRRWAFWGTAAGIIAAVVITGALTWAGIQTKTAQGKIDQANHELIERNHELIEANHELIETNHELIERKALLNQVEQKLSRVKTSFDQINDQIRKVQQEIAQGNIVAAQEQIVKITDFKENEMNGFRAILEGDLENARRLFEAVYKAYPTYHNVYEIYNQVLTKERVTAYYNGSSNEQKSIQREIMQKIVTDYSWGIPEDLLDEMKSRLTH